MRPGDDKPGGARGAAKWGRAGTHPPSVAGRQGPLKEKVARRREIGPPAVIGHGAEWKAPPQAMKRVAPSGA